MIAAAPDAWSRSQSGLAPGSIISTAKRSTSSSRPASGSGRPMTTLGRVGTRDSVLRLRLSSRLVWLFAVAPAEEVLHSADPALGFRHRGQQRHQILHRVREPIDGI